MEEINACLDEPTPLDFKFSELVGTLSEIKKIFPQDKLQIFNQGADPDTLMSCTRQWLANITNGNNILGQNYQDINLAKKEWLKAIEINPSIKNQWDYLQNALKQFVDDKLISGYSVVSTIEEAKAAIDRGNYIYSGSSNWDWASVRNENLYRIRTDGRVCWHAFAFGVAYNDQWFIGINSYGNDNGYFLIPYELFDTTFTKYCIFDYVDQQEIDLYKQKTMEQRIERIKALGITNGQNPDMNITRKEAMLMIGKLVELIELKIGKLN